MSPEWYEAVRIHVCPDCGGKWLGSQEMLTIFDRRDVSFTDEERDRFFDDLQDCQGKTKDVKAMHPEYRCRACQSLMSRIEYAYSSTVIIDRCPTCNGIFLDPGEIEKLQIWNEERDAYQENLPSSHRGGVTRSRSKLDAATENRPSNLHQILENLLGVFLPSRRDRKAGAPRNNRR